MYCRDPSSRSLCLKRVVKTRTEEHGSFSLPRTGLEPKTTLHGAEQQMGNERGLLLSTEVLYTDAAEGRDGFPASLMPSASLTGNPGPRLQGPGHPRGGALTATRASPVLGSPGPAPLSAQGLGAKGHFLGAQLPEGCGERKDPETSTCLPLVSHSPTWSSNLPGRHQKAISPEPALTDPASVCLRPPTSPHPQQQPPASPCPLSPSKTDPAAWRAAALS